MTHRKYDGQVDFGEGQVDFAILLAHTKRRNTRFSDGIPKVENQIFLLKSTPADMHVHSGDKPYKCDQCDIGFGRHSHLVRHLLTCRDDQCPIKKPNTHLCEVCKTYFSYKRYLVRHMSVHCGNKPYKCDPTPAWSK
jgi:uncharacterized Zn-finger protein